MLMFEKELKEIKKYKAKRKINFDKINYTKENLALHSLVHEECAKELCDKNGSVSLKEIDELLDTKLEIVSGDLVRVSQ